MPITTRILSLDGGGTWALLQARALQRLYPGQRGHEILSRFDYAFANSGGSIVLGGLLIDMSPAEIANEFADSVKRAGMYRPSRKLSAGILRLFGAGARYDNDEKLKQLTRVFGTAPLATLPHAGGRATRVVIVAFDYDRNRAFFFRSHPSPRFPTVPNATIAEAVHASTTAPVLYYDAPAEFRVDVSYPQVNGAPTRMRFWDGGVTGLNNPAAAAVSEALSLGAPPGEVAVLSLGTGTVVRSNNAQQLCEDKTDQLVRPYDGGPIADLKLLAAAVVDDPPDFATFLAHAMTGGRAAIDPSPVNDTNVVRLSPLVLGDFEVEHQIWRWPSWDGPAVNDRRLFTRLQQMDMDAHGPQDTADIDALGQAWMADAAWNQPIRFNFFQDPTLGLHAEIGFDRWSAAVARARTLGLV